MTIEQAGELVTKISLRLLSRRAGYEHLLKKVNASRAAKHVLLRLLSQFYDDMDVMVANQMYLDYADKLDIIPKRKGRGR